ncbi:MAG: hypothetical protein C0625_06685 [Arcobacter sp.]|nr:MAG: hypothetical protein C0625_06685 [Arcobacter sp.]
MKLLKLFLLLPIVAFSFEIEFSKKFSQVLPHDTLRAYITVTIIDDDEITVAERLEVFNEKIKTYDKVERKLASFTIRPKYKHSSNTPRVSGYVGVLRYEANSHKARYMDEFISELTSLKKNRDTSVSVNNLSWSVREDTYNIILDLLRLKSITWAERYAKNLSNDLGKDCSLKKIIVNTTGQFIENNNREIYTVTQIKNKSIPLHETNQEEIKINPKYILECK